MTDLPWFKFYHQDWLAGTAGLSMAERGCYITLLALMYDAGGNILRDDGRLARRCGCPTPNFKSALQSLIDDGKIVQDGDYLFNERVKKEVVARENIGAVARKNVESRWKKSKEKQHSENTAVIRAQCKSEVRSQNISSNEDITRARRAVGSANKFNDFWHRWPNKVGKPAAEKAFAKVSGEIESILLGIDQYIRDKPPDRPWLNPSTFLNQRRWEDAPAAVSQTFASGNKGWGGLYAELNGYGDGTGQKRIDENVSLLPRSAVDGSRDRDGNASGLPRDVIELFASGSS